MAASLVLAFPSTAATPEPGADQLVRPGETGDSLWPYTSRRRSVEGRTLAVNVVVHGSPDRVRRVLERRSDANWTTTAGEGSAAPPVVAVSPWRPARGSTRYTYVVPDGDATGRWIDADYQLASGTYLGQRAHVRAYPSPGGDWTALQAHTEYWDWFRLRHTVTGVARGAQFVERDLRDEPFVDAVSREYHGFEGGGSDGWLSVVRLTSVALVTGATLPTGRERWSVADVALPTALVAIVLGVRAAGIAAEGLLPAASPKLFAGALYPVLVAGPPLVVARLGRGRPPTRSALLAGGALGAGIVLDLAVIGVRMVPVRLALHRVALAGALAVVAYGVADGDRRTTWAGVAAWVAVLSLSLFVL